MMKNVLLSMVVVLGMTGFVFGQTSGMILQPPLVLAQESNSAPKKTKDAEELPTPSVVSEESPTPMPPIVGSENFLPCETYPPEGGPRAGTITTNVEYLLWFFDTENTPVPLVTSDANFFPVELDRSGAGGGAQSIFEFEDRPHSGARFTAEYLLAVDYDPVLREYPFLRAASLEVSGFFLGERSIDFQEDFSTTLVRPFFELNNRQGSGFLVGAPNVATGSISGSSNAELWGVEANGWKTVFANAPGQSVRIDVMGGFRYLNFNSDLQINSQTVYQDNLPDIAELQPFAGNRIDVTDTFQTSNGFFGPQVGFNMSYITSCFTASAIFKFGVGANFQELRISGSQLRTFSDGSKSFSPAGVYALPSNIGTFDRTKFGIVPEVNVKLAIPVSRRFTCFFGYTFMGWSEVIRPEEQIDPVIDITQIPNFPTGGASPTGLGRPAVPFNDQFLFIHGLNAGVMVVW